MKEYILMRNGSELSVGHSTDSLKVVFTSLDSFYLYICIKMFMLKRFLTCDT